MSDSNKSEMACGTNVASAPSYTDTNPPTSTIPFAMPPRETYNLPPELTVVEFAVPPLETDSIPPELTVAKFAMHPSPMSRVKEALIVMLLKTLVMLKTEPPLDSWISVLYPITTEA